MLGLVKRTCGDLKDIDTKKTLYCGLARPLLEYSCETWNPHTKRNIDKLEAVQRRATRWITQSDDDYVLRLSKFLDYLYLIGSLLEILHFCLI